MRSNEQKKFIFRFHRNWKRTKSESARKRMSGHPSVACDCVTSFHFNARHWITSKHKRNKKRERKQENHDENITKFQLICSRYRINVKSSENEKKTTIFGSFALLCQRRKLKKNRKAKQKNYSKEFCRCAAARSDEIKKHIIITAPVERISHKILSFYCIHSARGATSRKLNRKKNPNRREKSLTRVAGENAGVLIASQHTEPRKRRLETKRKRWEKEI